MKTTWLILCLYISFCLPSMADASMVAPNSFPTKNITDHYNAIKKDRALTAEEVDILALIQIADEAFDLKTLSTYAPSPAAVTIRDITGLIHGQMYNDPTWSKKVTPKVLNILKDQRDFLKNKFGPQSYPWAWVLNQFGDRTGAKIILVSNFNETYKFAMNSKSLGLGENPLMTLELMFKALKQFCNSDEKESFEKKIHQAKKQLSNVPQILT